MNHSSFPLKKRKYFLSFFLFLFILLTITGCSRTKSGDEDFRKFTDQLFRQEVAASTISLHYTLQDPGRYELENSPVTYGGFTTDQAAVKASTENVAAALHKFKDTKLSSENRLTYNILDSYLNTAISGADFLLYQEPLSPITGIHAQLPVLLSEYQFYDVADAKTYLKLLGQTDAYFDSLLTFQRAKSRNGLFMPDYQADSVISQCSSFVDMGEENYLYTTFEERLSALPSLSDAEKKELSAENAKQIEEVIFPAYQRLAEELNDLKGSGKNEKGLCFLSDGKKYYEYVVKQNTGISESIPTLQKMTKAQMAEDLNAMEQVLFPTGSQNGQSEYTAPSAIRECGAPILTTPSLSKNSVVRVDSSQVLDLAAPTSILDDLKNKITGAFPEIPSVNTSVKYVPAAMEEYLSPAFYMIPAIDNTSENVIYINRGQTVEGLNLFTTLAHEGYPGHLYQTVYFTAQNADPLRSILDFGGYVEGWATYAEMMSYYLAPLSKDEAVLLQKNSSVMLALYALADMGIHYDGWSLSDTAAFFKDYGITDVNAIQNVYELIVGNPGNYLKYYLGYLQFFNLKKEIAAELGDKFSQKEFHRAVLDVGPAPFDIVSSYAREKLLK
ncbi:DUF885 domain-containing protein [Roseburia hominis]